MTSSQPSGSPTRHTRRMPTQSLFYDRIMPVIFVAIALIMIGLVIVAAGVLLGFVHYR